MVILFPVINYFDLLLNHVIYAVLIVYQLFIIHIKLNFHSVSHFSHLAISVSCRCVYGPSMKCSPVKLWSGYTGILKKLNRSERYIFKCAGWDNADQSALILL